MKTMTSALRSSTRTLAVTAVVLASAFAISACAAALGIEDTKLDPLAGAGGGGAIDPCFEPIVPYLWFFTNDITQDSQFPLFVVPQSSFGGILGAYGKSQEEGKGHIVADARACLGDPTKDYPSADGAQFTLTYPGREPLVSNFYLNTQLQADAFATQTSALSLGGFLNVDALQGRLAVTPLDLGKQISSQKTIYVRANYLTTLRMDPSVGAPTPQIGEGLTAIPERWSCVGSVTNPPKTTQASLKINALVLDFASGGQAVAPNIGFRVCSASDPGCGSSDSEKPDYVSDDKGQVSIDVTPDGEGAWRGYLVVKGLVRKVSAECAVPK